MSSHGRGAGTREAWWGVFYKSINPIHEAAHDLISPQRPHLLIPSSVGTRISTLLWAIDREKQQGRELQPRQKQAASDRNLELCPSAC